MAEQDSIITYYIYEVNENLPSIHTVAI